MDDIVTEHVLVMAQGIESFETFFGEHNEDLFASLWLSNEEPPRGQR